MKQADYLDTKGRIFDIQRYSIHDGTGIRTIVFLKGCVLRCRWCCNPESQEYGIQTMMVAGKPKIIGRDVTVREVMETVVRDRTFYRRSGGGLTLSGGESLCQPEFAAALLRAAKENGINTAMESMACAPMETIEKILEWLDVYLCDVKHMNGEKHKEFTGRDNALMLSNIQKIAESTGLGELPEELRELAELRLQNPEMSLRELGESLSPPLSRSGVNHRLQRIVDLAETLPER